MLSESRKNFLESPFLLNERPEPVPGDLRIMWGVSVIALILFYSRSKRASFQKLHYFSYSVRTAESRKRTLDLFLSEASPTEHIIRFEPWLIRAISFAQGSKLVIVESGKRVRLTDLGKKFASELLSNSDALELEIKFIQSISKEVSEKFITEMLRSERKK